MIYVLRHKYDTPLATIADCRGVSESRISQELSGIQETLNKAVARAESGVSRRGAEEMARILEAQRERVECGEGGEVENFQSFALESFDAAGL